MHSDTPSFVLFLFSGPSSPASRLDHKQLEVRSRALSTAAVAEPLGGAEPTERTPLTEDDSEWISARCTCTGTSLLFLSKGSGSPQDFDPTSFSSVPQP